jgi:hypothetical protein
MYIIHENVFEAREILNRATQSVALRRIEKPHLFFSATPLQHPLWDFDSRLESDPPSA